jgi:protein-disulfide isomerase
VSRGLWWVTGGFFVLASVATAAAPMGDEDPALAKRIEALEAGQRAILKELQEIKALLQARGTAAAAPSPRPTPPLPAELAIGGMPGKGRPDAPVVMVEFSDFECPFCARYARETYPEIQREYVEAGKLRYVFGHYPLERLHPSAQKASEAAACAETQGRFWEMHDRLFANPTALAPAALLEHGAAIGLDAARLRSCLEGGEMVAKVRVDLEAGSRAGITGTPAFFLGFPAASGKIRVVQRIAGARPFAEWKTTLDALLAQGAAR